MTTWNHYHLAHSINDALGALRSSSGPARLVAGGTDYLLELQQGHHSPVDTLVDITCIPELTCLEVRGGELFIGAAVPVSRVTEFAAGAPARPGCIRGLRADWRAAGAQYRHAGRKCGPRPARRGWDDRPGRAGRTGGDRIGRWPAPRAHAQPVRRPGKIDAAARPRNPGWFLPAPAQAGQGSPLAG